MVHLVEKESDVRFLMETVGYFHDSCVKEMHYVSGAYVDNELSMYPINDARRLKVLIQCQYVSCSVIELIFDGLSYLRLHPNDSMYTCEILDASLILCNGLLYWCDMGGMDLASINEYTGLVICAERLQWRIVSADNLGKQMFYAEHE